MITEKVNIVPELAGLKMLMSMSENRELWYYLFRSPALGYIELGDYDYIRDNARSNCIRSIRRSINNRIKNDSY